MRLLKAVMLLVILALMATAYFYLDKGAKDNGHQVDKTINKEYKTVQDDKDSIVESNKVLLLKVSSLEKHIKTIEQTQDQQQKQLKSVANKKSALSTLNNKTSLDTHNIVKRVVALVNKELPKLGKDNQQPIYKINNTDNHNNAAGNLNQAYVWTDAMRSGVVDENGDYVPVVSSYSNANTFANASSSFNSNQSLNSNPSTHLNPFATTNQSLNTDNTQDIDFDNNNQQDNPNNPNNPSNHKNKITPAYTVPTNSVLSAVLTSGLVGRIPVDRQVTDPFRFNLKITDQSFYPSGHSNTVLQDVFASGTASGDLLLSCVRASIDSMTFIFADGTISDNKISEMGYLADEYGYPCIKGELITNAAQYLGTSALFAGISGGAKAFADAQQTTSNHSDGSSSSSITGSPYKLLGASVLSGAAQDVQKWVNSRAGSSFDVVFVPSGSAVQILTQQQINIDYHSKGRKLNHQLSLTEKDNKTQQLD